MKKPEEINIEELKTGLERCIIYLNAGPREESCDICPYIGKCSHLEKDALALIRQLEAEVPKWISVNEQAEPGEDGEYVCCGYWFGSGRKQVETAVYSGEWDIVNNFVLTHWMPLPEPPKEEER